MSNHQLCTTQQAAQRLCLSPSTLNKWRLTGGGPRFIKLNSKVLYDPADLDAWVDARKYDSTSEFDRAVRP